MHSVVQIKPAAVSALELVQREFPTYHPLVALARLAHREEVVADPKLEFEVHKAILPYVTPRLSSVEVTNRDPEDRRILVSLFEEHVLEDGRVVDVEVPLVTEVEDMVALDA